MTVPKQQILGWEDYPEPRVVTVRGTLVIEVSIPRAIRHLFGNGSGKTNNRRLSTGTTDPTVARRKMWPLAHTIYKQFDQMQADAANTHDHQTDSFALDTISALAISFNYNRGINYHACYVIALSTYPLHFSLHHQFHHHMIRIHY